MMPEEIGHLKHLRYLRFSHLNVNLIPRSTSSLYHLQFIILDDLDQVNDCSKDYFPRDMNNLFNLRYLTYSELNFQGIGNLKFLQELKKFSVKNENGYRIEELEHMNELHILRIENLKSVRDAKQAYNAKLCDKRKLTHLSINWEEEYLGRNNITDGELDERVLDNLQPHNYLKTLEIYYYMGARSSIWMNEAHLINNLENIELYDCLEWEILPPFGQPPFLKTLRLWKMPKVKRLENKFHGNDMCSVFPSLQYLEIVNLEALVDWFDASVVDGLFPCLTKLWLSDCPNLQELPNLPPKLESLRMYNIGWKTLNYRCGISKSIPLKLLNVSQCPNITSISLEGEIEKLEELTIKDLPSLESLPCSLANISSLECLDLANLPQVQE